MDRGVFVFFFKKIGLGISCILLPAQHGGSTQHWAVFLTLIDLFQLKNDNSPKPSQKKVKGSFRTGCYLPGQGSRKVDCLHRLLNKC